MGWRIGSPLRHAIHLKINTDIRKKLTFFKKIPTVLSTNNTRVEKLLQPAKIMANYTIGRCNSVDSWKISDEFWERVEPLIPQKRREPGREYQRPEGAGRKPMDKRRVFEAILYVLKTGIKWNELSRATFGSSSSVNSYFKKWEAAGVFAQIWELGLAEAEEMKGIAWEKTVQVTYVEKPADAPLTDPKEACPASRYRTILEKERDFEARFDRVESCCWRPVFRRIRRRTKEEREKGARLIYG